MLLSKTREFWFALIPVVGPDAIEFLFVNSAVLCCLQFASDLSQKSSHPTSPQSLKVAYNFEKRRKSGCMLVLKLHDNRQSANRTVSLPGLEIY